MSAIITKQFEQWAARQTSLNLPARPDTFVFAYMPDQDPDAGINPDEPLPPTANIVHTAPVMQYGMLNSNAVVFSVVLDTRVGDFDYNWIGLIDQESDTLCMIVHTRKQRKIATSGQVQGNTLTRTFAMEFNGAASTTQITVTPQTWQIDFSARIFGQDEQLRLANFDTYGQGAFFGDSFLIVRNGAQYQATKGVGYVGGIRASLPVLTSIAVPRIPTLIWADVSWQGQLTSRWAAVLVLTAVDNLADYTDPQGFAHYVTPLARIEADGSVTDLRKTGSQADQEANKTFLRKDQNLNDVSNKATARTNLDVYSKAEASANFVNQSGDVMAGELASTYHSTYRMVIGDYGTFWHQNGNALYLMLTKKGDQYGTYNDLRPLSVNLATGNVTMTNGLLLGGAAPALQMGTGTIYHGDGNIQGSAWGGYLSTWLSNNFTSVNNAISLRATQAYVDATFVRQLRLGANVFFGGHDDDNFAPPGYVVTGIGDFGAANGYGYAAPLQYLINGNWITMGV